MSHRRGIGLAVVLGTLAGAGCVEDRARPGPPVLTIVFDRTSVQSPDTVTGLVRAEDADGIDSVWLTVDSSRAGEEGFFEAVFTSRFKFNLAGGMVPGTVVPVRLEARDIGGFKSALDTSVTVIP